MTAPLTPIKPLRIAAIGCGGRTQTYLGLASNLPTRFKIVAAADPQAHRVEKIREFSKNPDFRGFASDAELLAQEKLADIMVIGTQDSDHVGHATAAMERGYDLLLEKPIASTLEDVLRVRDAAKRLNRRVLVCHVLRYSPFYRKVKEIVDSGELGEIISINASEGVGAFHQAHSYVRGKWAVVEKASPMIIAKSCHDMDIIRWVAGRHCLRVSSFGSLTHFTDKNAPAGAPARCTDGCPVSHQCGYNAELYATKQKGWLGHVYDHAATASHEQIIEWLRTSPWGRCVYRCDNTAVDHQTVNMEFEGGLTATFTMSAFDSGRNIEILGTKARLRGGSFVLGAVKHHIEVRDHHSNATRREYVDAPAGGYGGHEGGDFSLVSALYDEMRQEDPAKLTSPIETAIESHVMGFLAEESRRNGGKTIELSGY